MFAEENQPTARSNQPTATDDAALAENVWIEDGEGRSEPREVSLSDEIVFKWSGARNDDPPHDDDDDDGGGGDPVVKVLTLLYGDHRAAAGRPAAPGGAYCSARAQGQNIHTNRL